MVSLILVALLAAPGDPQVKWSAEIEQLTAGQRSTLVSQILSRAPAGVVASQLNRLDCERDNAQVCCVTYTYDPVTGASIRSLLISGVVWSPGVEASTQSVQWEPFCLAGAEVTAFETFVGNISSEIAASPIIGASFVRAPGTVAVTMSATYKRSMSAADCATYSGQTLVPVGIE